MPVTKSINGWKVWDMLVKIAMPLVLILGAAVVAHEVRISVIEGNRFTSENAHGMESRIMGAMPPDWLKEDIQEIKATVKSMDARLQVLERKVQ